MAFPSLRSESTAPSFAPHHWDSHLNQLLFDGEEVLTAVETAGPETATLLVTTHRVLVSTPTADRPFHAVHRPNVRQLDQDASGGDLARSFALRVGLLGAAFVVAGTLISPEAFFTRPTIPEAPGAGSVTATIRSVLDLLFLLDQVAVVLGAIALLAAVVAAGAWLLRRQQQTVLVVAGRDNIVLPGNLSSADRSQLQAALDPTRNAQSDSAPASG